MKVEVEEMKEIGRRGTRKGNGEVNMIKVHKHTKTFMKMS
jgi:hypothetical protein